MTNRSRSGFRFIGVLILVGIIAGLGIYFLLIKKPAGLSRSLKIREWLSDPAGHREWSVEAGIKCGNAPFIFPSSGLIGYLWGDHFKLGTSHQGIDILSGTNPGVTPVIAAYDGYLTRLMDWKSSVIIRVPSDPFQPDRQIWLYYTHMADKDGQTFSSAQFPPGTKETFVNAGTFLGYQGDYSGDPNNPVWVHLHFSIVKDNGKGGFTNELDIQNTYDPTAYLGINVNYSDNPNSFPTCSTPIPSQHP